MLFILQRGLAKPPAEIENITGELNREGMSSSSSSSSFIYPVHEVGLYRICFWEIRPEADFAGFVKQIRPEPVP